MKPTRVSFGLVVLLVLLVALPVSTAVFFRSSFYSILEAPISVSREASQDMIDLLHFHKNAREVRELKRALSSTASGQFQNEELRLENERLSKLLDLKRALPAHAPHPVYCRVIGRSPLVWSRTFLIDKGTNEGIGVNMAVMSNVSLVGKVSEAGPSVSKVILITDPNSKIGALIQRTRQEGVLFGTSSGECRMKYLSMDTEVKIGDKVETAGYGGFFPKSLIAGKVRKVWKEPGQMYQVASIEPLTDLSRIEEVAVMKNE